MNIILGYRLKTKLNISLILPLENYKNMKKSFAYLFQGQIKSIFIVFPCVLTDFIKMFHVGGIWFP